MIFDGSYFLFSFTERTSCIIVAGKGGSSTEVLGDLPKLKLPSLPESAHGSSMVLHNGTILFCGGRINPRQCFQLNQGTWKKHSTLGEKRYLSSAVSTQTATFLFGGTFSRTTYEYLPKDSTTWQEGKIEIPRGFYHGCAIAVKSEQEIWLIGGVQTEKGFNSTNTVF